MKKDIEVKKDKILTDKGSRKPDLMDRDFFGERFPSLFGEWPTLSARGMVRITENEKSYSLLAEITDIPKEDINVSVDGNVLMISAEHHKESGKADSESGYSREYRSFHQSFTLPTNVNTDQLEAHFDNGKLEVVLPKTASKNGRKIEIKSGSSATGEKDSATDKKEKH